MNCKGRNVSDRKGRSLLYKGLSQIYYHNAILCKKPAVKDGLCEECTNKQNYLYQCIKQNKLSKDNNFRDVSHEKILHGYNGDPIPLWSHIEGGEWFKKKLQKGFMKEKTSIDEKAIIDCNGSWFVKFYSNSTVSI